MTTRDTSVTCRFCSYKQRKDNVLRHMKTVHTMDEAPVIFPESLVITSATRILFINDKIMGYCFNCHTNKRGMFILRNHSELEHTKQICRNHKCKNSPLKGRQIDNPPPSQECSKQDDLLCFTF